LTGKEIRQNCLSALEVLYERGTVTTEMYNAKKAKLESQSDRQFEINYGTEQGTLGVRRSTQA